MSRLVDKLKKDRDYFGRKAASPEEIAAAERALKVMFAPEYRDYVAEVGAATIHGHELTGVCANKLVNVIEQTIKARELNDQIASNCYVVENTHYDGIIIWQDAAGTVYSTRDGCKSTRIAGSIEEYLNL